MSRNHIALIGGAAGLVAVAAVAGGLLLSTSTPAKGESSAATPAARAKVERRTLNAATQVQGTLGYSGAYAVANMVGAAGGNPVGSGGAGGPNIVTQIARPGSTVVAGGTLYTLNAGLPVILLTGDVPAWRSMQAGISDGPDVRQLETNLAALGFGGSMTIDKHWDADTTAAVEAWQKSLGLDQTGTVQFGSIVFEPEPLRVVSDTAGLGSILQQGAPVLQATSTQRVVTVSLDPALQTEVAVDDKVSVVLPDGSAAAGTVSDIGTVATAPSGNGVGGSGGSPTIDVTVTLDDPAAGGSLDQAPVGVKITTATAANVLAVPVSALVELLEGGYAVQVDQGGELSYVAVKLGLFADGWVEVSGPDIAEGQSVVVAQ